MLILESDKENKINFEVDIKSTERINGPLKARLVVCSNKMSYIFEGVYSTDNIEFIIPALPHDLREGIYKSKLEIIIEDRYFVPIENIDTEIKQSLKIEAKMYTPKKETAPAPSRNLIEIKSVKSSYGRSKLRPQGGTYADDNVDVDAFVDAMDMGISDMDELPTATATMGLSSRDADMLAAIRSAAQLDDDEEEELESEPAAKRKYQTAGAEGASLKDIAKKMGYAGPAGVKNLLYKLEDKTKYFASLDEVWFKRLMKEFALAYIDELKFSMGSTISKADASFIEDLKDDPEQILSSAQFRVWAQEYLNKIYKQKLGKAAPKSYR